MGEIDTSPWNYFPLSELLLVPLIVLYRTEESRVIPRLSVSLRLIRLRWLNRLLALSPKGCYLPLRSHQKNRKEGDEASRERNEHNQEKTNPIKSPKLVEMELKVAEVRGQRRTRPKSKALASKNQFEPLKMLQ